MTTLPGRRGIVEATAAKVRLFAGPLLAFALTGSVLVLGCGEDNSSANDASGEAGAPPEAGAAGESGSGGAAGKPGSGGAAGEGGAGGRVADITVPAAVSDGDVQVSCSVRCGDQECQQASVFVSACAIDTPGLCYEVTPIDDPSGSGNTYIVSINGAGDSDVIEGATCTSAGETAEGLPVDLLFVIDTSSSMAGAINGVLGSIDAFVDGLASQGVDMRIGGIAFADTSPLANCAEPDTAFAPFTEQFGPGTETEPESFNYWLGNVSASHCGDYGGSDIPENALDALGYALGHDAIPTDAFPADAFDWDPAALHVIVLITDAPQHDLSNGSLKAHFSFDEIKAELSQSAVVHVVGPNYGCYNTNAAGCACNVRPNVCDEDCPCDLRCPAPDCEADTSVGLCDAPTETCDPDCPGYLSGSSCDIVASRCDFATGSTTEACLDDFDCARSVPPLTTAPRRCEPSPQAPFVDIGELTLATRGSFTTLPADGSVDLTKLPLTGVLVSTEQCEVGLADGATAVRCVYLDEDGHQGEVIVDLK